MEPCNDPVRIDREVRVLDGADGVGRLLGIRREQISPKDLNRITSGYRRETSQVDRNLSLAGGFAIQDKEDNSSLIGIVNR